MLRTQLRRKRRAWLSDGAFAFPCDPAVSPLDEPAHWSPQVLGTTLIYEGRLCSSPTLKQDLWQASHSRQCTDGEHIVAQIGSIRFRLWQVDQADSHQSSFLIPVDRHAISRAEANLHYLKALRSPASSQMSNIFAPTSYQRRRLVLLLRIAEAHADGASARKIAFSLVLPRTEPLSGATWKGSNEKRQTLRLIREGKDRIAGGYLRFPGFGCASSEG